MRDFFDRLLGRRSVVDELQAIEAAIERGEDVSDRVIFDEQRKVDRSAFAKVAGHLARTAYFPRTIDGDIGAGSGFGGSPLLPPGIDHPTCPNCRRPMPLLAQLALDDLPKEVRPAGDGLLQAFYCDGSPSDEPNATACDVDLEGWRPFSRASVARLVPTGAGEPSIVDRAHPPQRIEGWDAREGDLPTWEEASELGIEYPDEYADDIVEVAKGGDKLGGWPSWVQSVEYPDCPRCGNRMVYVLQIDSEDNVPVIFGDLGTGHITQCPQHPDVLAFGWASS